VIGGVVEVARSDADGSQLGGVEARGVDTGVIGSGPGTRALRDRQRAKVYEAENLVHRIIDRSAEFPVVEVAGSRLTLPVERHFATLESVQRYVDAVLAMPTVGACWPRAAVPVAVRERSGQQQADYQRLGAVLAVPLYAGNRAWALRELVILHELAHHLADTADEEPHGPAFTARLIALASDVVGEEAGFLLRTTLWDNGVQVGSPRSPNGPTMHP